MGAKENAVQKACLDLLVRLQVFHWRSNNAPIYDPRRKRYRAHNGIKGLPDICGVLPGGRALFVECKAPGGKLSEAQRDFHASASEEGAVVIVAWCVDDLRKGLMGYVNGL